MGNLRHYFKVVRVIISSVFILVMNDFSWKEGSANLNLSNYPMLMPSVVFPISLALSAINVSRTNLVL